MCVVESSSGEQSGPSFGEREVAGPHLLRDGVSAQSYTPGNHKWTEPTGLKVVELGCVSLSSWAFVRSRHPLATEMSSTCVCVQLENVFCVGDYRFSIMRSVGGKSTCSILVTYIDRLQTHLRRLLCSGLEYPTLSQLLSQSHIFDCCKKLL